MRESIVMLLNRAKTANKFMFAFLVQSEGRPKRAFSLMPIFYIDIYSYHFAWLILSCLCEKQR